MTPPSAQLSVVAPTVNDDPDHALERLYRSERTSMVRLAHLLTGSADVGEELVHEAFLKVRRNWHAAVNPPAYLRTTVVNLCRSYHRTLARQRDRIVAVPTAHLDPDIDEMWDALGGLNSRQRTALVLRYYEDLSVDEIARLMDCRPGTVKSLIHRGLARLKETIDRDQ
ncbi:MAG TPA: RNA polymerase sigma factor [Acidimicrobiales bacterium]|jgi:RNA polymerase sigma factor (sigma-70 family)|nr:RNA polymerase sigma factor [Acidimicrobiales bacterium]